MRQFGKGFRMSWETENVVAIEERNLLEAVQIRAAVWAAIKMAFDSPERLETQPLV
jgi:hypothetical protein